MRALLLLFIFTPALLIAQEKCATNLIRANEHQLNNRVKFEGWLKEKMQEKELFISKNPFRSLAIQQQVYRIPVVFHVIHSGTEIGVGTNLSEAKIQEQLDILNRDFRRLNDDTVNTPAAFRDIAADTQIEFVMAKRDPEGLPTNGIVRVLGSKSIYSRSEDVELKSLSFWPPEDYLNIHITNLSSGNLGYAQYPFSNLDGVASELDDAFTFTDGVVLDYEWVGYNDDTGANFDSYGRTATHEIGHFLGLRHIWGDSKSCSIDDFCDDTPPQSASTSGCPSNQNSCNTTDMIQNFMDYTDDVCMNLFTRCQKERMRIVLENSPRRKSLLSSPALNEPIVTANDLGVRSVIFPEVSDCESSPVPSAEVRNYGTNNINSFRLSLYLNDSQVESRMFDSVSLDPLDIAYVKFDTIAIPADQVNKIEFRIEAVNGGTDGNAENNSKVVTLQPFDSQLLPYSEDFESSASVSRVAENGNSSLWTFKAATDSFATNKAAVLPFYNQEENFGVQDFLLTRILDLSAVNSALISFKYAYAARSISDSSNTARYDGLIVAVSTNCGKDFLPHDYLFESYGSNLATVPGRSDSTFITSSYEDWEEVVLNLTNYTGYENVQVAFIGLNGSGNNIYVDDIEIRSAGFPAYDLGLRKVTKASVVSCEPDLTTNIEIKNFGYEIINTLTLDVSVNGESKEVSYENLGLLSGYTKTLGVNLENNLQDGENSFSFSISSINEQTDEYTSNNTLSYFMVINQEEESIPLREDFETDLDWTITSPDGSSGFEVIELDSATDSANNVLVVRAYDTEIAGKESYLVSRNLKTHDYDNAALKFRYSYASQDGFNDNLKVLLSVNCGKFYSEEVFNLNSEQLAITTSNSSWRPSQSSDWKTAFIDLSEYLIWPKLRIAIVFTDGNGNNLYIDDVEVITTNDPDHLVFEDEMVLYPNPASGEFNLAMNLKEKKTVHIKVVDLAGKEVFAKDFPNTLNQTYNFQAPAQRGMYLVYVTGPGISMTKRLVISR